MNKNDVNHRRPDDTLCAFPTPQFRGAIASSINLACKIACFGFPFLSYRARLDARCDGRTTTKGDMPRVNGGRITSFSAGSIRKSLIYALLGVRFIWRGRLTLFRRGRVDKFRRFGGPRRKESVFHRQCLEWYCVGRSLQIGRWTKSSRRTVIRTLLYYTHTLTSRHDWTQVSVM